MIKNNINKDLLAIFQAALEAVSGKVVVKKELAMSHDNECFHIIAIGKAADAMVQGVPLKRIKSALVISKHGHISDELRNNKQIICIESDHPVPKVASLKAGEALLDYLEKLPEKEPCLFLISGGASALVEVLEEDWDLKDLEELTDYLLANAYSIDEMNAVRQRLSKIKGGGLWSYISQRSVNCLIISDVPNDDPAIIGSGLLFEAKQNKLPELPQNWIDKIGDVTQINVPKDFQWKVIASLDRAKKAAATKAESLGYQVNIMNDFLEGDAVQAAKDCVRKMRSEENRLFIWGGETTVKLSENSGKGGRNQHLALAAAIEIAGQTNTVLLAAGTDGSDGMTTATGAMVDGQTVERGLEQNLNASDFLLYADSNSFFQKTNELIVTGATGTNVMDLVFAIKNT